ncbi:MAG: TorF family putative porin [Stagnimonas sp.]|nr:TorF family putative porin [Stagnimonas sp.]
MKMKQIVVCAALMSAACVSAPAFAGATGNAGVFSDYIFRGISQTGGAAAVQGGLDYSSESGLYAGTWISNINFGAGTQYETDFYGGFAGKVGEFGYDVGVIQYYYRGATPANTTEFYAGGSLAGLSAKLFYTNDLASTKDSAFYVTANYPIALSKTLTLTPAVGYAFGDAYDSTKEVLDYGVTLSKALNEGFTFSFGLTGTDRDGTNDETLVIGLKKSFDL